MRKEISADVSPPPPSALPGEGRVQPSGGCWVPPVQRALVLGPGEPWFFYLNSKHCSFFWENLAVKLCSGDFVAFPSGLFRWYITRSGWEASLLSTWGCLAPAPSCSARWKSPSYLCFPPGRSAGSRVTSRCLMNQEMRFFSSPAARDFSSALKLLFCSLSNFLTLFLTCGHQKGA